MLGNRTLDLNATVAMDMIWCPPGTLRWVARRMKWVEKMMRLNTCFLTHVLPQYEVTQSQYEAVMTGNTESLGATPSQYGGTEPPNRKSQLG